MNFIRFHFPLPLSPIHGECFTQGDAFFKVAGQSDDVEVQASSHNSHSETFRNEKGGDLISR